MRPVSAELYPNQPGILATYDHSRHNPDRLPRERSAMRPSASPFGKPFHEAEKIWSTLPTDFFNTIGQERTPHELKHAVASFRVPLQMLGSSGLKLGHTVPSRADSRAGYANPRLSCVNARDFPFRNGDVAMLSVAQQCKAKLIVGRVYVSSTRGTGELPLSHDHDLLNRCQSQTPTSTISEPMKAATTSRSEIDTLSRPGNSPSIRNRKPPMSAPARPTARLRNKPKPRRSQVISGPARLPPSRPTMIQTMI